jgi:hypothetical protein
MLHLSDERKFTIYTEKTTENQKILVINISKVSFSVTCDFGLCYRYIVTRETLFLTFDLSLSPSVF